MCVKRPKVIIAETARVAVSVRENQRSPAPSPSMRKKSRRVRASSPPLRAKRSDRMPPTARAKSASSPKLPAAIPADARSILKRST
jgi:hypothetical protein